jgi:hypothetical protein
MTVSPGPMNAAKINREKLVGTRADSCYAPGQFMRELTRLGSNTATGHRPVRAVVGIPLSVGEPNLPGTLWKIPADRVVMANECARCHVDDTNAGNRIGERRVIDSLDL